MRDYIKAYDKTHPMEFFQVEETNNRPFSLIEDIKIINQILLNEKYSELNPEF